VRRPFQERRHSRGDKLQRPVPAVNAQAFSKFKAALKNRTKSGTRRAAMRFPLAPRVSPIPPNARSLQSKNRVRPRARFFNLHLSQAWNALTDGTFGSPVRFDHYERTGDHKADRAVSIRLVSDDADAQRDQFLANHFSPPVTFYRAISNWYVAGTKIMRAARLARPFCFPGAFPENFFINSPAMSRVRVR
jgi:hypothetical protein